MKKQTKMEYVSPCAFLTLTECRDFLMDVVLSKGMTEKDDLGEDGDNARYNINADTAAAKIAVALHAEKFVQLTNVAGILRNIDDPSTLIKRIERTAIGSLKATGVIGGGMIPKIDCCETALKGGVPRTHIIDGRVTHSLLIEMFSDRGIGTMIY